MKKRLRFISEEEFLKLNSAIKSERDRLIFGILYETGCYVKELVNIKIKDIDFKKGSIHFQKKTSRISKKLCNSLKFFTKEKKEFIFATSQSKRMTAKRARQLVQKYTKDIIGEKLNPKSIRYGYFADSLSKNISLNEIQTQTGAGHLRIKQIRNELSPSFDLFKGISYFIIGISLIFLLFYFASFIRVELLGYVVYENYTAPPALVIACDYSHCPQDVTYKVAYDDKKYVHIKTKEILLDCESEKDCKDECELDKRDCEEDCFAANLTRSQEDACKKACDVAKHLCEDECHEESQASCKEWFFGYLNVSWNSSVPLNMSIGSAKAIVKHKVSGKYPSIIMKIWDYGTNSFEILAELNESSKWITEEIDLGSYIHSADDVNNLRLQYYLLSDPADKAKAKIDWVAVSINFTTEDYKSPSVSGIRPLQGSIFLQNSSVEISANVSDNSAVGKVLANVSWNNSSQIIELTNFGGFYKNNFTNTASIGTYYAQIIANDSFGNLNNSEVTWFSIYLGNTPPSNVSLLLPLSGNITFNRNPVFIWNNSIDYENDSLTYQILVSNSTSFDYILWNYSTNETNYTSAELPTDEIIFWKVRAYDGYSYGGWSDIWNLTVQSSLIVSLPISSVNFGDLKPGENNDTEDNSPHPFLVQNDGNIHVDIVINGTDLWIRKPNPSSYYQYKIGVNESNSFNSFLSTMNWAYMLTTNAIVDIADLKYQDESDTAEIDLNITAPGDEPPGFRNSTIIITAEAS